MTTRKAKIKNPERPRERGNAFFLVMIGVVLFGGLMFTLSRGARQGGENISQKQAEIAASEILSYVQRVERGVANVMNTVAFSEQDISFENDLVSGYTNASCTSPRCEVFNPSGGSIAYIAPSSNMSTSNAWLFSGENTVLGVGNNSNADLLIILNNVRSSVCEKLNERLNIDPTPTDGDGIDTTTLFTGSYNNSEQISGAAVSGLTSACVLNTAPNPDEYLFYHVLRER